MKITQHINIHNRESLAQVRNYVANECIESRTKTKYLYQTFFDKWDLERVSYAVVKSVSSNWINETIISAFSNFSKESDEKGQQSNWYGQLFAIARQLAPIIWSSFTNNKTEVEHES